MSNDYFSLKEKPRNGTKVFVILLIFTAAVGGINTRVLPTDDGSGASLGECEDLIDNDMDGAIDALDPHCDSMHPQYDGTESGAGGA